MIVLINRLESPVDHDQLVSQLFDIYTVFKTDNIRV